MKIYLMQHGEAQQEPDDPERALSAAGREQVGVSAAAMKRMMLWFDVIVSSPRKRACETAEIVADTFGHPRRAVQESAALDPSASAERVLEYLQLLKDRNSVLIIGHLPGLQQLASLLLCNGSVESLSLRFENAGVCGIEAENPMPGQGKLQFLLTPRQLRLMVGQA